MGASVGVLLAGAFGKIKTLKTEETHMLFEIKRKHIRNGICSKPHDCAAALALREVTGFARQDVTVLPFSATVASKVFRLSSRLQKFIEDFDNGKKVQPGRFRLSAA